jgi:nicotinate-nucleotide pyrophosphorylase (carboxylating)
MDNIDIYLREDLGNEGDITSDSLFNNEIEIAKANIISNEKCIIAGLDELKIVFEKTGAETKLKVKDGDLIKKNQIIAEIQGSFLSILKGERLALNFISKMSGIASETKKLVDKCNKINPNIKIAATRKTTPGFRKYEKKAVILGGGEAHRYGLFDVVMIKDNHIKFTGSIEKAIDKVINKNTNKIIEVEVENKKDALIAVKKKIDVIMLDNFKSNEAEKTAREIRKINNNVLIEISGGINKKNILKYAAFADRISLGYITQSVKAKDFSLNII